jgi:hypothetical protein
VERFLSLFTGQSGKGRVLRVTSFFFREFVTPQPVWRACHREARALGTGSPPFLSHRSAREARGWPSRTCGMPGAGRRLYLERWVRRASGLTTCYPAPSRAQCGGTWWVPQKPLRRDPTAKRGSHWPLYVTDKVASSRAAEKCRRNGVVLTPPADATARWTKPRFGRAIAFGVLIRIGGKCFTARKLLQR